MAIVQTGPGPGPECVTTVLFVQLELDQEKKFMNHRIQVSFRDFD
jgi:hypothetical protein